ncbi:3-oxoacyl-[acyl-carrier-protein] reductase [Geothermobacter hydrogeniphilus]|uniref:3-oxoacyl-[acyl-carrier-protein] reductase n=1 Tax=Geothermobacter hydrogeniphilus TaxID=1969733 RepID=A0A2K2H8G3_9BACT|nr:3-oxoacyl-[acyl-carrier-protein] reductase [Geothermobacter hydrogeniphilus]PNU19557.1 3-oxoacyl-[acyl-carrier-protein] reductase [Geothermobacter hydrogeniphilus]
MPADKVALVTGASRGIGRAICLALAARGCRIVAAGRDRSALKGVADEIEKLGAEVLVVTGDVSCGEDVNRMVNEAREHFSRLDILVNNAGLTRDGLLLRMKDEDWDAVLDANLKGSFMLTRAVAKIMTRQRYGRIINISSVVGEMGNPGQANYCASKAGLIGLTKSNARELAKRNITVNVVAPGFIVTSMTEVLDDKAREELVGQIPLGRIGNPEDVANAVVFLASEAAGYITGQVLSVNGGMYM